MPMHHSPMLPATVPSAPIAVYRLRPLRWRDVFTVFLPAALLVLAPLGYGLYVYIGYTHYGETAASLHSRPWLVASFPALALALAVVLRRLQLAAYTVVLRRDGLQLRRFLRPAQWLRWEDIAGIATATVEETLFGRAVRTRQSVTLYLESTRNSAKGRENTRKSAKGREKLSRTFAPFAGFAQPKVVRLDGRLAGLPELATRLKARLYPRLYRRLRTDFLDGYPLQFGPLTLQRQCLQAGRRQFPWEQVARLTVQSGFLVVELSNRSTLRFHSSKIPNLELLLQLVREGVNP